MLRSAHLTPDHHLQPVGRWLHARTQLCTEDPPAYPHSEHLPGTPDCPRIRGTYSRSHRRHCRLQRRRCRPSPCPWMSSPPFRMIERVRPEPAGRGTPDTQQPGRSTRVRIARRLRSSQPYRRTRKSPAIRGESRGAVNPLKRPETQNDGSARTATTMHVERPSAAISLSDHPPSRRSSHGRAARFDSGEPLATTRSPGPPSAPIDVMTSIEFLSVGRPRISDAEASDESAELSSARVRGCMPVANFLSRP